MTLMRRSALCAGAAGYRCPARRQPLPRRRPGLGRDQRRTGPGVRRPRPGPRLGRLTAPGQTTARGVDPALRSTTGPVTVMLELDRVPAATAYAAKVRTSGHRAAVAAFRAQTGSVESQQRSVQRALRRAATRGHVLFGTHALYSGLAVTTDAARLDALAAVPGVKAIHLLTPKRMTAETYDDLDSIGAPEVWEARENIGAGDPDRHHRHRHRLHPRRLRRRRHRAGLHGREGRRDRAGDLSGPGQDRRRLGLRRRRLRRDPRLWQPDARAGRRPAGLQRARQPRGRHARRDGRRPRRQHLPRPLRRDHAGRHVPDPPRGGARCHDRPPEGLRLQRPGHRPTWSPRPSTGPPTRTATATPRTTSTSSTSRSAPTTPRPRTRTRSRPTTPRTSVWSSSRPPATTVTCTTPGVRRATHRRRSRWPPRTPRVSSRRSPPAGSGRGQRQAGHHRPGQGDHVGRVLDRQHRHRRGRHVDGHAARGRHGRPGPGPVPRPGRRPP